MAAGVELPEVPRYDLRRRETFAKALLEMSDGNFRVRVFAPTEIVPGLQPPTR